MDVASIKAMHPLRPHRIQLPLNAASPSARSMTRYGQRHGEGLSHHRSRIGFLLFRRAIFFDGDDAPFAPVLAEPVEALRLFDGAARARLLAPLPAAHLVSVLELDSQHSRSFSRFSFPYREKAPKSFRPGSLAWLPGLSSRAKTASQQFRITSYAAMSSSSSVSSVPRPKRLPSSLASDSSSTCFHFAADAIFV